LFDRLSALALRARAGGRGTPGPSPPRDAAGDPAAPRPRQAWRPRRTSN